MTSPSTDTAIHRFVAQARAGELARVVARMPSGWAVLGDPQVLEGYCLLYPDPVVAHLNALDDTGRAAFLRDMGRLGDALLAATDALRVNYEILGNQEPALHAHVVPRYAREPEPWRTKPFFTYDWDAAPRFDAVRHAALAARIRAALR